MQKTIAAMFCVVCLVAASDARAQVGSDQGGAAGGYYGAPGGGAAGPGAYGGMGIYGGPATYGGQGAYGEPGANYGTQQPRPQSGVMGILPKPSPGAPAPRFTPNPEAIGVPTIPGVPITACMNRDPPEGTVITKSVRRPSCGEKCESELQIPAGSRMLICRGQAIPKGYRLELLTTTPDCSCYGADQNAYMIRVENENDEFKQTLPQ